MHAVLHDTTRTKCGLSAAATTTIIIIVIIIRLPVSSAARANQRENGRTRFLFRPSPPGGEDRRVVMSSDFDFIRNLTVGNGHSSVLIRYILR